MGSMYRIKEQMEDFTKNEKKIASFILDSKDLVINSSVQDIADAVGVSPAAIVRFSKKAGFRGYSDMKVALAKDHQSSLYADGNFIIDGSETFDLLVEKARLSSLNTVDMTYKILNLDVLKEVADKVINARRIYLGGIGGSGTVADDLYQKLTRIDKHVTFSWDNNLLISSLTHSNEKDVMICISYSGNTKEMVHLAKTAKAKGATTVAITQMGSNALSNVVDYVLHIPREESDLRLGAISSRNSMFIVTDLIYYNIVNSNFSLAKEKLVASRKLHAIKNEVN